MKVVDDTLQERLNRLGIECDEVPTDQLTSATTALACFPMYMIANCHAWTKGKQWEVPLLDIPGFEAIREAFALGRQERSLEVAVEHRHLLGTLLKSPKPSDLVLYEFALETLASFLNQTTPEIAESVRTAVARTMIAVAKASGEGLLGTGEKINRQEFKTIGHVAERLNLRESESAAALLDAIDK